MVFQWDILKIVTNKGIRKDFVCMKFGFFVCLEKRRNSYYMEEVYFSKTARRTDVFTLADYISQCVVEQLILIEQGIFQMIYFVYYLNFKVLGVSVVFIMLGVRIFFIMRLAICVSLVILYYLIKKGRIKYLCNIRNLYYNYIIYDCIWKKNIWNVV